MLQNIFLIPKIKSDKREAIGKKLHDPVPECSGMQSSIMTLGSGYRFYNLRRFFLNEDGFGKQKNVKR